MKKLRKMMRVGMVITWALSAAGTAGVVLGGHPGYGGWGGYPGHGGWGGYPGYGGGNYGTAPYPSGYRYASRHAEHPGKKPAEHPGKKPAEHPGKKPAEHPGKKPAEHPGKKPAEHPGRPPAYR